jgi:replicative DNA helicase
MNFGELLLSKVVEQNDKKSLQIYGIKRHHFQTKAERAVYDFILDHIEKNGECPDYRTLVGNVSEDFTFMPDVRDSFESLANELKKYSSKVQVANVIETKLKAKFEELSGPDFLKWMKETAEGIEADTGIVKGIGKSVVEMQMEMKEEYEARKEGKNFKTYKTPFPLINKEIGGLSVTDIYGVFAESGRGKSYLMIVLIDELLRQGANVLVKSYELRAYSWLSRLLSVITAREGLITNERQEKIGLANKKILSAKLEGDEEKYFLHTLGKLNEYYPGKLILQAKGDKQLSRTLDDLERELIQHPEIDVVVLDPFYGLSDVTNGRNANKTAGGAAEGAARRFEVLVGEHQVIGLYAVQATIEKAKNEEGKRELKMPKRDQIKTTKALLDICTVLLGWDSADGLGLLGIEKGRNGGEDVTVEMIAMMDHGVIREPGEGVDLSAMVDINSY